MYVFMVLLIETLFRSDHFDLDKTLPYRANLYLLFWEHVEVASEGIGIFRPGAVPAVPRQLFSLSGGGFGAFPEADGDGVPLESRLGSHERDSKGFVNEVGDDGSRVRWIFRAHSFRFFFF